MYHQELTPVLQLPPLPNARLLGRITFSLDTLHQFMELVFRRPLVGSRFSRNFGRFITLPPTFRTLFQKR